MDRFIVSIGRNDFGFEAFNWMLDRGIRRFRINMSRHSDERLIKHHELLMQAIERNDAKAEVIFDLPGNKVRVTTLQSRCPSYVPEGLVINLIDAKGQPTTCCGDTPVLRLIGLRDSGFNEGDQLQFHYSSMRLFSIESGFRRYLDNGSSVPDRLRQAFDDHGILLGQDSIISLIKENTEWLIVDKENKQELTLIWKKNKLNIYNAGISCRIVSKSNDAYRAIVESNGEIRDGAGVVCRNRYVTRNQLLAQEIAAICRANELGGNVFALSFADTDTLLKQARNLCQQEGKHCKILAKIESEIAVTNIETIAEASDGLVLARGDMQQFYDDPTIDKIAIEMVKQSKSIGKRMDAASRFFRSLTRADQLDNTDMKRLTDYRALGVDYFWSDETSYSTEWKKIINGVCCLKELL